MSPATAENNGKKPAPPSEAKAKEKAGRQTLGELLKPMQPRLMLGRFIALLSAVAAIAPYIALTRLGDLMIPAWQSGSALDRSAVMAQVKFLVLAFLTQLGLYFLALTITHFADLKLVEHLRRLILKNVGHAPLSWFSNSTAGQIRKAVQDDTKTLHVLVAHGPVERTAAIATPLLLLGYAFYLDWRLGLLALAIMPIYLIIQALMMVGMGEKTAEMDTKLAQVSATAVEFTKGIQVVKAFGRTGQAHGRFQQASREFSEFYHDWVKPMIRASSLSLAISSIPVLLLVNLGGGVLLARAGYVTLTEVLVCTLIALAIPLTVEVLTRSLWYYQLAGNAALRLVETISAPQLEVLPHPSTCVNAESIPFSRSPVPHGADLTSCSKPKTAPALGERVEFKSVSYAYESDGVRVQALRDVSLVLEPGTITALVGPSGSGKSTLATMLARFRDPDSGYVLIGGRDLRSFSEDELYNRVAFVLQDAQMLRISIRDNIALSRPEATESEIVRAAQAAQIWEEIQALPHGLDTIVNQETSVSGGQAQRIAIARALLADTPILIMDEALVATDPDCAAQIQAGLNHLVEGRTVVVIAHHAESVRGVDQIVVLKNGQVSAMGTAAELAENAYWKKLIRSNRDTPAAAPSAGLPEKGMPSPSSGLTATASDPQEKGMPSAKSERDFTRERESFATDPILVREYRGLVSEAGQWFYNRAQFWITLTGIVEGLALLSVLPAFYSFYTAEPCWGLGLGSWLIVLAVLAALGAVGTFMMFLRGYAAAEDGMYTILNRIGNQLARLPLGWFGPWIDGKISSLVSQGTMIAGEGIAHMSNQILRNFVASLTLLVGAWVWQWQLGLALSIALPTVFLLTLVARKIHSVADGQVVHAEGELANRIVEFSACQPALRSAGRADHFAPLQEAAAQSMDKQRRGLWISSAGLLIQGVGVQAVTVTLIVVAALLGVGGTMDPLSVVAFMGISLRFTKGLTDLTNFLFAAETARNVITEIKRVLLAKPLPQTTEPAELSLPGQVVFDDVTFGYVDSTPVLRGVSFVAEPRTVTAIVGPSGSGKTTLFRLIARFWDVSSGSVRVGGTDVRDQTTAQLMEQLSMVFQDVYLYNQTLIENIRVGREDATEAEILQVAELAGVSEIAQRLPRGWDTAVGEGGGRLSGGERQRVSVARALIKDSPVVLFDEATSALDPENESQIEASISQLRRHATVLVIAHKLDTVRQADQIIVLDEDGTIAQCGTHDSLVKVEGIYRQFWQQREQAAGWEISTPSR